MTKSQEHFDFLLDKVIIKNSVGGKFMTWLGRQTSSMSSCSRYWLDETSVTLNFTVFRNENCSSCENISCCAMYVWNDSDHKQVGFRECNSVARAVCILEGDWVVKIEQFIQGSNNGHVNSSESNETVKTQNQMELSYDYHGTNTEIHPVYISHEPLSRESEEISGDARHKTYTESSNLNIVWSIILSSLFLSLVLSVSIFLSAKYIREGKILQLSSLFAFVKFSDDKVRLHRKKINNSQEDTSTLFSEMI